MLKTEAPNPQLLTREQHDSCSVVAQSLPPRAAPELRPGLGVFFFNNTILLFIHCSMLHDFVKYCKRGQKAMKGF